MVERETMTPETKSKLCATCPAHEETSGKVNTMWGAGKLGSWILPVILTALAVQGFTNGQEISVCRENTQIAKTESVERYQEIEIVLNTVGINLKHLMEAQGLTYTQPEEVKHDRL